MTVFVFLPVMHTSASLALNESWDPNVRDDMEMMLNKIVPEGLPYRHSCEGPDDMVSPSSIDSLQPSTLPCLRTFDRVEATNCPFIVELAYKIKMLPSSCLSKLCYV